MAFDDSYFGDIPPYYGRGIRLLDAVPLILEDGFPEYKQAIPIAFNDFLLVFVGFPLYPMKGLPPDPLASFKG